MPVGLEAARGSKENMVWVCYLSSRDWLVITALDHLWVGCVLEWVVFYSVLVCKLWSSRFLVRCF